MSEAAGRGATFDAAGGESIRHRYDLAQLQIQRHGEAAIASYTLLHSQGDAAGVTVASHNEAG